MGGGHEGERRQDDATADTEGASRQLQAESGVGDGNAVLDFEVLGEPGLELSAEGTVVRQPPVVEDHPQPILEALPLGQVRPAHMTGRLEGPGAAEERQIGDGLLVGGHYAGGESPRRPGRPGEDIRRLRKRLSAG